MGNTFLIVAVTVVVELILGMAFALFMHKAIFGRNIVRTAILLPYGIITVVSAFAFKFAVTPNIGGFWHLTDPPLNEKGSSLIVIMMTEIWKTTPFMSLLLLAGLATVPNDYVEAAKVDGANAWQRLWRVILPNMKSAILVAVLFRTLDAVRIFDTVFIQTRGGRRHRDALPARLQPADQPAESRARLRGLGPALHHRDHRRVHLRQGIPNRSRSGSRGALMATIAAGSAARPASRREADIPKDRKRITPWAVIGSFLIVLYAIDPDPVDPVAVAEAAERRHRRRDHPQSLLVGELLDDLQHRRLHPAADQLDRHRAHLDVHRRGPGHPGRLRDRPAQFSRARSSCCRRRSAIAMFPPISIVGPLFNMWRSFGLYDTWLGLIIPYMTFALPMAIWTLSAFFRQIPWDLEQAAAVDGASPFQAFRKVIVPLAAPGVFTSAILVFFFCWNDFVFAITLTSTNSSRTVPAALNFFTGASQFSQPTGAIAAAAIVVTVPIIIVVLIFQRRIVAGLTSGAVKG